MSGQEKQIYHFVFMRHGESVGNVEERWQGQSDYPLTDRGRAQAQTIAEAWKADGTKFDLAITSPLVRAKETAEIIAAALDVKVESDPIWMERHIGEITGLTATEVRQHHPRPAFVTPYESIGRVGEGDWVLFLRAGQALQGLLSRPVGRYLIVSHGGLLNQLMHAIIGIAPHADPSGVRFRFDNTAFARVFYLPHQHRWVFDALNNHAQSHSIKQE